MPRGLESPCTARLGRGHGCWLAWKAEVKAGNEDTVREEGSRNGKEYNKKKKEERKRQTKYIVNDRQRGSGNGRRNDGVNITVKREEDSVMKRGKVRWMREGGEGERGEGWARGGCEED